MYGFLLGDSLLACAVTLVEALDATGGVDDLHLTGKEWVAGIADIKLYQRVRLAIVPDNRLRRVGAHGGAGEKSVLGRGILKDDKAVLGVCFLFHKSHSVAGHIPRLYLSNAKSL